MLIGKAMTYLDNQWPQLIRVLNDGRLEVDNNRCENALRPFVLERLRSTEHLAVGPVRSHALTVAEEPIPSDVAWMMIGNDDPPLLLRHQP